MNNISNHLKDYTTNRKIMKRCTRLECINRAWEKNQYDKIAKDVDVPTEYKPPSSISTPASTKLVS